VYNNVLLNNTAWYLYHSINNIKVDRSWRR